MIDLGVSIERVRDVEFDLTQDASTHSADALNAYTPRAAEACIPTTIPKTVDPFQIACGNPAQ